ncbi:MAG: cbb3-type cytochrome oxidase subunit 3 [Sphaerotilus sulfidivorans]|uniref:cbb3-type cytochrome oxidase subunit 3 n=1 Tax=Sphaerotilus sulfidivorans TaxID=639200 RepID=UPI003F38F31E
MDIVNDLRSLVTGFFLILFLGIVAWAYSSRNRSAFDEAASLALDGDEPADLKTSTSNGGTRE